MLINEKSKIKKLNTFLNGNFDISKLKNSVKLNCGTFGCVYKIDEKYCIKISKISNKHLSAGILPLNYTRIRRASPLYRQRLYIIALIKRIVKYFSLFFANFLKKFNLYFLQHKINKKM